MVTTMFIIMLGNLERVEAPRDGAKPALITTQAITPALTATLSAEPEQTTTPQEAQISAAEIKTQEIRFEDGSYKRWNEAKQCYDESNSEIFTEVPKAVPAPYDYDPNWQVAVPMPSGCTFYMKPNQGKDNQYDERGK